MLDACIEQTGVVAWLAKRSQKATSSSSVAKLLFQRKKPGEFAVEQLVRDAIREHRLRERRRHFSCRQIFITKYHRTIARYQAGRGPSAVEGKATAEQGAGDQGLMFGFACDETPGAHAGAHHVCAQARARAHAIAQNGKVGWLRPDAKSQVSVIYEDGKPIGISCVVSRPSTRAT